MAHASMGGCKVFVLSPICVKEEMVFSGGHDRVGPGDRSDKGPCFCPAICHRGEGGLTARPPAAGPNSSSCTPRDRNLDVGPRLSNQISLRSGSRGGRLGRGRARLESVPGELGRVFAADPVQKQALVAEVPSAAKDWNRPIGSVAGTHAAPRAEKVIPSHRSLVREVRGIT